MTRWTLVVGENTDRNLRAYLGQQFLVLSAEFFILLGCLRQLQGTKILREQIQSLFDLDEKATTVPLARSTWSDPLASPSRNKILREAVQILVTSARNELSDRLAGVEELGTRPVLYIEASYQKESVMRGLHRPLNQ